MNVNSLGLTLGNLQKNKYSGGDCNAKLAIIFTNSTYLFIMYIICDSLFKLKGTSEKEKEHISNKISSIFFISA